MKALFIGGTGTISSAAAALAVKNGVELTLLNRGSHPELVPQGAELLQADINDEDSVCKLLQGRKFDVVADFIAYLPAHVERDIRLFSGKTNQYIFISSASAYQKPASNFLITESTPLCNPYWQYSRNKIACEEILMLAYRSDNFPVTIIRPSHTYGDTKVPVAISGSKGNWQVLERMRAGKPIIVHGDGLSLWVLTHNTDFAKGFVGLMDNPHAIGEAVHITSDEVLTWNAIYRTIGKALDVEPNLVHIPSEFLAAYNPEFLGGLLGDKSNSVVFDNTKIKTLVPGFCAQVRFDQGIRHTVDFLLSHPEYQVPDPEFDTWCDKVISAYCSGMLKSF
ncbi:MAG TPA: SDR family oxidoreductase [Clostridiales bacterium]|nr:SDR family oxidoreductase [Clostridiales bacterium]